MGKPDISAHFKESNLILAGTREGSVGFSFLLVLYDVVADAEAAPEVHELLHVRLDVVIDFVSYLLESSVKIIYLK